MGPDELGDDEEYEVIKPPRNLKSKARELSAREASKFDPIKAAEAALQRLSGNFDDWMKNETQDLAEAWKSVEQDGLNAETMDRVYQATHNIKGQAVTLGFPLVGQAAALFCHLMDTVPDASHLPKELAARYVAAIRAMVSENARDENSPTGKALVNGLADVTYALLDKMPKPKED